LLLGPTPFLAQLFRLTRLRGRALPLGLTLLLRLTLLRLVLLRLALFRLALFRSLRLRLRAFLFAVLSAILERTPLTFHRLAQLLLSFLEMRFWFATCCGRFVFERTPRIAPVR
jgi:hypothetical protein